MKRITIIGAGLTGSLLAINLGRKGYQVDVFERRADPRVGNASSGRSINLALSERGLHALREVDLAHKITKDCVPMPGRLLHLEGEDEPAVQAYGTSEEHINSISRAGLNQTLIEEADKLENVTFHFDSVVTNISLTENKLSLENLVSLRTTSHTSDHIIAADGGCMASRKIFMIHNSR